MPLKINRTYTDDPSFQSRSTLLRYCFWRGVFVRNHSHAVDRSPLWNESCRTYGRSCFSSSFAQRGGYFIARVAPAKRSDLLRVGFIALALMLVAEFTLGLTLRGVSIAEYSAGRDPIAGTVYYIMLMAFALMPIFVCQEAREHAHPSKLFKNTPVAYANPAAIVPTARVEKPERHHDEVDHRLLTEPIVKNTPPVMIIERATGLCSPNK